jgi:hypothetical protein
MLAICNWLVNDRPDILRLASQMLEAKSGPSGNLFGSGSVNFFSSVSQVKHVTFIRSYQTHPLKPVMISLER